MSLKYRSFNLSFDWIIKNLDYKLRIYSTFSIKIRSEIQNTFEKNDSAWFQPLCIITTTSTTITTTTTPVFEEDDSLVVMWSTSYKNPSKIKYFNFNGTESQLDWGYDNGIATAYSRCSFMFEGRFWVLGNVLNLII